VHALQKEIQDLESQNTHLKGEIFRIRQEPFSLEIEITAPYYNFQVNDREVIEVPIEFDFDNQSGS
jgi:hypothetical protein